MALAHTLPHLCLLLSHPLSSASPLLRRSCPLALPRSSRSSRSLQHLFLPPLPRLPTKLKLLSRGPHSPPHLHATTAAAEVGLPSHDGDDAAAAAATASATPPPAETQEEFQIRPLLAGWMPPRYLWRAIAAFIIAGQVYLRLRLARRFGTASANRFELVAAIELLTSSIPAYSSMSTLQRKFIGFLFSNPKSLRGYCEAFSGSCHSRCSSFLSNSSSFGAMTACVSSRPCAPLWSHRNLLSVVI